MDKQLAARQRTDDTLRFLYSATRHWLGRLATSLFMARQKRHRCVDILALAMRDSAVGG